MEFVSDYDTEEKRLTELYDYLIKCDYPPSVIKKGIRNARLQGPGPNPASKQKTLPFVTTHCSNMNSQHTVQLSNKLLQNTNNDRLKTAFKDTKVVLALKQPPNLLRHLSTAAFNSTSETKDSGIFTCGRPNCGICNFYLQPCTSFITSNGTEWFIKSHITCHSKKVIYFLKCLSCNESTTYSGKTNDIRKRTNNHISNCRTGRTTDKFDRHVFHCNKDHVEPFFKLYIFVEVMDDKLLDAYEKYIHEAGHDTMNR